MSRQESLKGGPQSANKTKALAKTKMNLPPAHLATEQLLGQVCIAGS